MAKRITATCERTQPMKVSKHLVLRFLREHPEDFRKVVGDQFVGTLEEFLDQLEAAPGQWFVGGVLEGE